MLDRLFLELIFSIFTAIQYGDFTIWLPAINIQNLQLQSERLVLLVFKALTSPRFMTMVFSYISPM